MIVRALPPLSEILLVEDDPGRVRLMREELRAGRWRKNLHVAPDEDEALAFLRGEGRHADAVGPDVIVLGLSLVDTHGTEIVGELRKAAPGVPVVAVAWLHGESTAAPAGIPDEPAEVPAAGGLIARFVRDALVRSRVERERAEQVSASTVHLAIGTRALVLTLPAGTEARVRGAVESFRYLAGRLSRLRRELPDVTSERPSTPSWELIDEVLERYGPVARERGIRLVDMTLEKDLPPVRADREELLRVLSTLVAHLLDLAPPGSRVDLYADSPGGQGRYHGDEVYFTVGDHGPGIPEEHLPRLFDPFATAWRVVDSLGGRVWMSSRPDRGASFGFVVPSA